MTRAFVMSEADGLKVRNFVVLVDIDENIDFEQAAIAAAIEYCNTEEGRDTYLNNCNCFNWGDFNMCVPEEICKKHGFKIIDSYLAKSFNFDQRLVDDDDICGLCK